MPSSTLPPPPPRPPHARHTARSARPTTGWRDLDRPPSVPHPPESRWGLGDAFLASGIFFATSIALALAIVLVFDADPLDGVWFPLTLMIPQLAQFGFVWWTVRTRGAGLSFDLGFAFRPRDLGIGLLLFGSALVAAGLVALAMTLVGFELPTAAVAELTEDIAAGDEASHGSDSGGPSTPDDDLASESVGAGITVWIVVVAILASTAVPVIEEVGYRGLWFGAVTKRGHGEWWAITVSSAVFAVAHLEPARTPIIFVLGFVLGWGRRLTNRIGASIVAHALINGTAFAALLGSL